MYYEPLLPPGVEFSCHYFCQLATVSLSAVRWGRQALWLVLAV